MKKLLVIISLILVVCVLAHAEIYVKSKVHQDAFAIMGQSQPAKDEITEQWIGDDRFAAITPDSHFIIDLKKNVLYMINHKEKTYLEATLPLDLTKLIPPEMAQMMSAMMKMTVSVSPNGQTKKIGQWNCTGYDAAIKMMMPMKITVWASADVPLNMDQYMKMFINLLKVQMNLDDTAVKEMMKIKGYWIATETNMEMMGSKMHQTTEVIEISKKTPDPSVFSVPAGYKKTEQMSMKDFQKR